MKIKVVNVFKLDNPSKIIFDVEITEGEKLIKGQKFVNQESNIKFTINSVGHTNPSISIYYPLIVSTNSTDISNYKNKIFIME